MQVHTNKLTSGFKIFLQISKKVNMKWRWVDRIDAHSWKEYDWKQNPTIQGVLEGAVDAAGDKALGASFDIYVHFPDTDDYQWKRTSFGTYMKRPKAINIKK